MNIFNRMFAEKLVWERETRNRNPPLRDVGERSWAEFVLPGYEYPYRTRVELAKLDFVVYASKQNDDHGTGVMTFDYLMVVRNELNASVKDIVYGYAPVAPRPPVFDELQKISIPRAGASVGRFVESGANDVQVALRGYNLSHDEEEVLDLYLYVLATLEKKRHARIPGNTVVELLIREWHRGDMGVRDLAAERLPTPRTGTHPGLDSLPRQRAVSLASDEFPPFPDHTPKTRVSLQALRVALR